MGANMGAKMMPFLLDRLQRLGSIVYYNTKSYHLRKSLQMLGSMCELSRLMNSGRHVL